LKAAIRKFRPSVVRSLELQNGGYVTLRGPSTGKPKSLKLLVTNWGSDIFWFQRFQEHKIKLQKLLQLAEVYSAECERVAVHEITVPAVKNVIRVGLELAQDLANAEKNLNTIKNRATTKIVNKVF
jgi:hypothetical protein